MKKIILIMVAIALTATMVNAQTEEKPKEEVKTLFSGCKGMKSNFYAGPSIKFSKVNDESAIFAGGRGAWTINKTFSVGIAGYGLLSEHKLDYKIDTTSINSDFNFSYGGLYFEYIFMPREYIHCSANVLFAFGGSNLSSGRDSSFIGHMRDNYNNEPWKHYLVIEPTLAVEFNITSFFRIAVEGSYRIANDIYTSDGYKNNPTLNNKTIKLNGLSYGLTLEFGIF